MWSHDEYDWDEPAPAAISITIDSSITIAGDKNTVSVYSPGAGPLTNDAGATDPIIDTTNTKDIEHSQDQMGQLATTLINALKAQDLTEESGRKRPITVMLKRGIVIKGVENNICVGDARSVPTGSRRTYSVYTLSLSYILYSADLIVPSHGH